MTQGGEFILEQTDVLDSSSNYVVDLPKNIIAGSYVIDIEVIYKDETQDKSFSFIIKEEREVVSQPQAPLVPNLNVAKKSASEQFTSAIGSLDSLNCKSISIDPIRDECYFVIARDTKDETICALIEDIPKQERCYLTQVMGGNTITCTILSEPQNIAICENIS